MWFWVAAGWIGVAVALALLHHRLRRADSRVPTEVGEFLVRLESDLVARHPQVRYLGLLPGQFTALLRVRGQDTPVALHEAWRRAHAFPHAFPGMVDSLVKEIEEAGLDHVTDHEFATVAAWILPQIRSRAWLEEQGCFGDAGLVHRLIANDLAVVYVIDDAQSMTYVCRAHLQHWRKREADVHNLAIANLQRLGDAGLRRVDGEPLLVQTGDGYDAARVLLLDENVDGLLVAIPERDTLWVAQERGLDLPTLMAATEQMAARAAHPVSAKLYRVHAGRLETVSG